MNWINIHTDTLRSEEYLGADPTERATWLNLLAWCVSQENGGVIEDCRDWKDRMWQQLCGVTKAEVETTCFLFGFDGQNLKVSFYPDEAEKTVQARRENGRKGGRPKKATTQPVEDKAEKPHGFDSVTHMDTFCLNEKKGKDKERVKVKEGEATRVRAGASPVDDLKRRINSLRPEWQQPSHWSYAEEQHLHNGAMRQMAELDDDDWQTLGRYFKAHLDNGAAYWRPNSRGKLVESFADVWAGAQRWRSKHKPRMPAPRPIENTEPVKHDPAEYADELADYKATTGCDLTPQEIADDRKAWSEFIKFYLAKTI